MAAYNAAIGGSAGSQEAGAGRAKRGTVAHALALYFASLDYAGLAASTKTVRRRQLEAFRERHSDKPLALFERKHLEALLAEKVATPHEAKNILKAIRAMIGVALAAGLAPSDPTIGIKIKTPKSDGHSTWSEADIARFEARWPIGSRERLALGLLLYTAQRRSDVVRMGVSISPTG
jgi:integrase